MVMQIKLVLVVGYALPVHQNIRSFLYCPTCYKGQSRYNGHLPTAATVFAGKQPLYLHSFYTHNYLVKKDRAAKILSCLV